MAASDTAYNDLKPKGGHSGKHQDGKKSGNLLGKAEGDHTEDGHGIGIYRGYEGEDSAVKRKKAPGLLGRMKEELQAIWTAFRPPKPDDKNTAPDKGATDQ